MASEWRGACDKCHKSKRACDGQFPCATCITRGILCSYERPVSRPRKKRPAAKASRDAENTDMLELEESSAASRVEKSDPRADLSDDQSQKSSCSQGSAGSGSSGRRKVYISDEDLKIAMEEFLVAYSQWFNGCPFLSAQGLEREALYNVLKLSLYRLKGDATNVMRFERYAEEKAGSLIAICNEHSTLVFTIMSWGTLTQNRQMAAHWARIADSTFLTSSSQQRTLRRLIDFLRMTTDGEHLRRVWSQEESLIDKDFANRWSAMQVKVIQYAPPLEYFFATPNPFLFLRSQLQPPDIPLSEYSFGNLDFLSSRQQQSVQISPPIDPFPLVVSIVDSLSLSASIAQISPDTVTTILSSILAFLQNTVSCSVFAPPILPWLAMAFWIVRDSLEALTVLSQLLDKIAPSSDIAESGAALAKQLLAFKQQMLQLQFVTQPNFPPSNFPGLSVVTRPYGAHMGMQHHMNPPDSPALHLELDMVGSPSGGASSFPFLASNSFTLGGSSSSLFPTPNSNSSHTSFGFPTPSSSNVFAQPTSGSVVAPLVRWPSLTGEESFASMDHAPPAPSPVPAAAASSSSSA